MVIIVSTLFRSFRRESLAPQEAKNGISHRGRALQLLRTWLVSNEETFAKEAQ